MQITTHLKHDIARRTWKVWIVVPLQPDRLVQDIPAFNVMFDKEHHMNLDELSARVVEISRSQVGARTLELLLIVLEVASDVTRNRPAAATYRQPCFFQNSPLGSPRGVSDFARPKAAFSVADDVGRWAR